MLRLRREAIPLVTSRSFGSPSQITSGSILELSLAMPPSSEKGRCKMTDNEGESSDNEEEATADYTVRGAAGLVTVSCPRQYPRNLKDRKRLGIMIPEDYTKTAFIDNFWRLINVKTNRTLLKAYCVDEPHKRFRKSKN